LPPLGAAGLYSICSGNCHACLRLNPSASQAGPSVSSRISGWHRSTTRPAPLNTSATATPPVAATSQPDPPGSRSCPAKTTPSPWNWTHLRPSQSHIGP